MHKDFLYTGFFVWLGFPNKSFTSLRVQVSPFRTCLLGRKRHQRSTLWVVVQQSVTMKPLGREQCPVLRFKTIRTGLGREAPPRLPVRRGSLEPVH